MIYLYPSSHPKHDMYGKYSVPKPENPYDQHFSSNAQL